MFHRLPQTMPLMLLSGMRDISANTKTVSLLRIVHRYNFFAFYHCYEFIASDHVTALQSNRLNKYSYLFVATMVSRLQEKYSFNREINDLRINKEKVLLPVDSDSQPDWQYME